MKVPKKQNTSKEVDTTNKSRGMVVIPYVQAVSERVARVYKSYGIAAAMKPHKTLRKELMHPKDKRCPENMHDAIYECPCMNCELSYIGEMGENLVPVWRSIRQKWKKCARKLSPEPGEKNLSPPHINLPPQTMWLTKTMSSAGGGQGHRHRDR